MKERIKRKNGIDLNGRMNETKTEKSEGWNGN